MTVTQIAAIDFLERWLVFTNISIEGLNELRVAKDATCYALSRDKFVIGTSELIRSPTELLATSRVDNRTSWSKTPPISVSKFTVLINLSTSHIRNYMVKLAIYSFALIYF